jgi:hypothetical protein
MRSKGCYTRLIMSLTSASRLLAGVDSVVGPSELPDASMSNIGVSDDRMVARAVPSSRPTPMPIHTR